MENLKVGGAMSLQDYKMKKRANASIVFLVVMTVVLSGAALFIFNLNKGRVESEISDFAGLSVVYAKENQINFYIDEIIEKSAGNINNENEFIENFKKELEAYRQNNGFFLKELEQIESQINEKNVEIKENKVFLKLQIKIDENFGDKIIISYLYNKQFKKDL